MYTLFVLTHSLIVCTHSTHSIPRKVCCYAFIEQNEINCRYCYQKNRLVLDQNTLVRNKVFHCEMQWISNISDIASSIWLAVNSKKTKNMLVGIYPPPLNIFTQYRNCENFGSSINNTGDMEKEMNYHITNIWRTRNNKNSATPMPSQHFICIQGMNETRLVDLTWNPTRKFHKFSGGIIWFPL
jgi:hypothetical protein